MTSESKTLTFIFFQYSDNETWDIFFIHAHMLTTEPCLVQNSHLFNFRQQIEPQQINCN